MNSDINTSTRTQIKEYVKTLDVIVQRLYEEVEIAYLLTMQDTGSDEFQIVARIRDVFLSQLKLRQK